MLHHRHREVLDRVAEHARLTASQVVGAADQVLPGTACRRRARSTRARASSPRCCRCSPRRGGPPASGRPAAARHAAGPGRGCGGRCSPPTSSSARCAAGRVALGSLDGLPGAVRSAANERRLDARRRDAADPSALSDDERRWLDNCLLVRSELHRVRAARDPVSLDPLARPAAGLRPPGLRLRGPCGSRRRRRRHRRPRGVPGARAGFARSAASLAALTGNALRVTSRPRARLRRARRRRRWPGWATTRRACANVAVRRRRGRRRRPAGRRRARRAGLPRRGPAPDGHRPLLRQHDGRHRAARHVDRRPTTLVLVGSPGPNVERASAAARARRSRLRRGQQPRPGQLPRPVRRGPDARGFGAVRFQAEDVTRNSWRVDLDDHSKYFDAKTESLANIVDVVVGDYAGSSAPPTVTRCLPARRHQHRPGGRP